jgi:hypothetical protein
LPAGAGGWPGAEMKWLRARPWLAASAAALPPLVWWLAWYPGFYSSDSIDQMGQVVSGEYSGIHPAAHTLYLSALSLGGLHPGWIPLFQVAMLSVLIVYSARTLHGLGARPWTVVVAGWAIGFSAAIGPTTNAVWKDVPFGLAALWAWIEAVRIARDREAWGPWVRLGLALSIVWMFRQNGPLTVIPFLLVAAWFARSSLARPAAALGSLVLVVAVVTGPVYAAADARLAVTDPATVFLADVAASYNAEPSSFSPADLQLMAAVAPLELWRDRYRCEESTPLIFDLAFDLDLVDRQGERFLDLERRILLRDPDSVIGHRLCAAAYLVLPAQDAYFHRPPYDIPPNTLGLTRSPLSTGAFRMADAWFRWAEVDSRLWFTWRPWLVIIPSAILAGWLALRRSALFLPSSLFLLHLLNVAATSPSPEFRYAYPLYLIGLASWPLLGIELQRNRSARE